MRVANLLVVSAAAMLVWACASTKFPDGQAGAQPASVELSGNDCAVMAAVAKEHYKFGPENPPPPLKGMGEPGWRPQCNWTKYGLAFADYNDVPPSADPRERLKWVEFHRPRYDGTGATIETGIMHGPLAGMGYECRLRSGIAGWTVTECKTSWVS
ncbi:MAG: hypothetical protein QM773_13630 [Hyphomonadaceae bacterium]